MNKFTVFLTRNHPYGCMLLWSTLAFLLAIAVGDILDIDMRLAEKIYATGQNSWQFRDAWVTEGLIHQGGRTLTGVMLAMWLLCLLASYFYKPLNSYRKGFWYVLASALAAILVINILKQTTGMDCPWDLTVFGGDKIYHALFESVPTGQNRGRCFPAGHASAMYAWLGLFYFAQEYRPAWKLPVLFSVLAMGLIFGFAQQVRGAHFLSHDLWTAFICWMIATLFAPVFLKLSPGDKEYKET